MGAGYVGLVLQLASSMILARLLTPSEIGIYTAGFSVVAIAHLFRDFGLNQYLIQEHELTYEKISAAFTLTIITSWLLGLVVFTLAAPAATFFAEPGVKSLLQLLSINFFIIPFGSITLAVLRKNLRFEVTATIAFIASLVGVGTSVITAMQGTGYMCLAYGSIAECLSMVALSVIARPHGLRFGITLKGSKSIFKFASTVGAANIISRVGTSGTDAIVARVIGMPELGHFSRATGTFSLFERVFIGSINGIVLPLFSRDRMNLEALQASYIKSVDYTLAFAWPFFAFLLLYTDELVFILYGAQWETAVLLVKTISIAGFILPLILFIDSLFIAVSRPDATLHISLATNASKLLLVAFAAWQWGLNAAMIALTASFFIKAIISCFLLRKILALDLLLLCKCAARAMPLLLGATLPPTIMTLSGALSNMSPLFQIVALAPVAAIGWLAALIAGRHPFSLELNAAIKAIMPSRD
ncbi:oligosaccharide flippase family protein [Haliea sp.]|uniref:oligosaccharide flippase family protein n=1 Tax=Haliea sp. TaxID=1932666 RepID=UPI00352741C7